MATKYFVAGLILLLLTTVHAEKANATTEIRLINGAADTGWITAAGTSLSFSGFVGAYDVTTAIGISDTNKPSLDLSATFGILTEPPGSLTIEVLANPYTATAPGFHLAVSGGITASSSYSAYGGNSDNSCPAGVNMCTPSSAGLAQIASTLTFNTNPFAGSTTGGGNTVDPYSLAIVVTIPANVVGGGHFDAFLSSTASAAVPEPNSMMLLLIGLTALLGRAFICRSTAQ